MSNSPSDSTDLFSGSGGGSPFDVATLLFTARRLFWVPLVLAPLAAIGGFVFSKTSTPEYRALAEIRLESRSMTPAASLSGPTADGAMSPEDQNTIIRTFVNPIMAREVVKKLKLGERPYFNGKAHPSEDDLVAYIMANTKANIVVGTRLLQVAVDYPDPYVAMELANAMAEAGMKYDRDQRSLALRENVQYLEDEVKKLEANLVGSETRLNDYTRTLGSISIDQDVNIAADKLKDLNMRSTEARAKRLQLESSYREIQAYRENSDALLGIESIRSAPGVASLISKINDLKGNLAKLLKRYREANPFVIQARTELAEVEKTLRQQALDVAKGIEADLAAARRNEEGIAAEKAEQEGKVIKVKEESIQSNVLRRQIDADRLAYEAALKRLNEELSQTRSQLVMMQMSGPAGPGYMVSMSTSKTVGVAGLGGLFLGLGLIALVAQLDKTIKTVESAESALGVSVLSAVPRYGPASDNPELPFRDYPVMMDRCCAAAEAFRTLRVAAEPPVGIEENAVILLVGAAGNEGTSFCAANLAVALGQSGQRTLLVDADLRRSSLEERIFDSVGQYGLSDYLTGRVSFPNIIRSTPGENVDVVTAGTPHAHPAELLSKEAFATFLEEARLLYDRVVFDSAPVTVVSDTLRFAHLCQTICFVLRFGKTTPAEAKRAFELLARGGVKVTGTVLNNVSPAFPIKLGHQDFPEEVFSNQGKFEFPVHCPSCNRTYDSPDDFIHQTGPPGPEWSSNVSGWSEQSERIVRRCNCNTLIVLPPVMRRDNSSAGAKRREAFAELMSTLEKSGLSRDAARTSLLLTLKMGRSEMTGEAHRENSEASQQRRKLYDEVLERLVAGRMSRAVAETKLLHAIRIWQNAP